MSIFTKAIDALNALVSLLKRKPSISEIGAAAFGTVQTAMEFWQQYKGADKFERIRQAWAEFDLRTGIEGKIDLVNDIPQDVEERLFDGIKDVGEILSLYAAGFYGTQPTLQEVRQVSTAFVGLLPFEKGNLVALPADMRELKPAAPAAAAETARPNVQSAALALAVEQLRAIEKAPATHTTADQIAVMRRLLLLLADR